MVLARFLVPEDEKVLVMPQKMRGVTSVSSAPISGSGSGLGLCSGSGSLHAADRQSSPLRAGTSCSSPAG